MARPRQHDASTAEALVDAAGHLLADEGPRALALRRVAEAAGVSTTAVYSLFDGKDGLVRALHRTGFQRLADELATVTTDDPLARVRELGLAYHRAGLASPHLYDVMFDCPIPEFAPTEQDLAVSLGTLAVLREAVADAVAAGVLDGDVEDLTMALWGVVHGLTSLDLAGALGAPDEAARRVELGLAAAVEGLRPA